MSSAPLSPIVNQDIDSTLREDRSFRACGVQREGHIKSLEEYEALYAQSIGDPESFWRGAEELHWFKPWTKCSSGSAMAKWFVGGKLNLSYNCVDRHALGAARQDALIWEASRARCGGSPSPNCTSRCRSSPMSSRASESIKHRWPSTWHDAGAGHRLWPARASGRAFGHLWGFAANAIADRVNDSQCVAILTQDSSYRRATRSSSSKPWTRP